MTTNDAPVATNYTSAEASMEKDQHTSTEETAESKDSKLVARAKAYMLAPDSDYVHPSIQTGAWGTGLFNCFDHLVPNCLMATFCPCFSVAQIASRVGFKYQSVLIAFAVAVGIEWAIYLLTVIIMNTNKAEVKYHYDATTGIASYSYSGSNGYPVWGYVSYLVMIIVFIAFWQLRTRVRERFSIPGSPVEDFFIAWCCSCCALAQMATHVKSYKPGSCAFSAPDELPPYEEA